MDVNEKAQEYRNAEVAHSESLQRLAVARTAYDAAALEINDATVNVGTTMDNVGVAKAALLAAALDGMVPS